MGQGPCLPASEGRCVRSQDRRRHAENSGGFSQSVDPCLAIMLYFCTAGRGTEVFLEEEIKLRYRAEQVRDIFVAT